MTSTEIPHPKIVSREEWLAERKAHLAKEKEITKLHDKLTAERRRLPMVKLEKDYQFDSPEGKKSLGDLFEGRTQLIVYHFMFAPEWEKGCMGCTGYVDALGDLSMLNERNTTFALIARAPQEKLDRLKSAKGWKVPFYSAFGSDFNYDFHVTLDESKASMEYNYKSKEELEKSMSAENIPGEHHGLSVFFKVGDDVYHTYSSYARGVENLTDAYPLLEATPYGRQEDWEDSPEGWPQQPTYG
jgi:predicted dithiol-disulfide oxidoreductase (DUF899 family)